MSWLKKKSVLIPLDLSDSSYDAIAPAKEFVEENSALNLIHVLTPLHPADPAALWDTLNDDERKQKVKVFLHKKLSELNCIGIPTQIAIGDPVTEIVDYAEEINADLIVMPSHGRTGAKRFLLRSVAERVVRLAPCPVLILK